MLKSPSSAVIHANLLGFEFFVIKRLHFVGKCQNILNMNQFKHSKIHLQHWLDWAADKLSLSQFLSSQLSAFYSANFFDYFRLSCNSFSYFTVLIKKKLIILGRPSVITWRFPKNYVDQQTESCLPLKPSGYHFGFILTFILTLYPSFWHFLTK